MHAGCRGLTNKTMQAYMENESVTHVNDKLSNN